MVVACSADDTTEAGASENGEGDTEGHKIAFFSAGASNNYLITGIEHAEVVAEEYGMDIDVFDGQFDPLHQLNQIQNAIATEEYDGFVVEAVDGNQVCDILTNDAVDQGIAISAINIELCGVEDTAAEGTLTFVGGQGVAAYQEILQSIFKEVPDGGKMVAIGGPATGTPYLNFEKALEIEMPKKPEWELVGLHSTDYTANKAYQVAQNVLQANSDLDVIFSNYSGMTSGIVEAAESMGRDDVKIFDFGGDEWAFNAVEEGKIQQTAVMLPKEEVERGIEALHLHFNGEDVPEFYDLLDEDILPGTIHVNKENIDEFREKGLPEY
ncbi:sugar ABC transporter substrate-binding protein [Halobacillus litoralis]|uniref:sugar ABC transporter substrate-binding protein n=1 Tax=Halobacillus litoralis TaxID=45668 RepID=UPI00248FD80F|nr:sugar ABC transporter substrate-binding protein [Halobacillus litoralis]